MSKIGKLPIAIPQGVEVKHEGSEIVVTGPKGTLKENLYRGVTVEIADGLVKFNSKKETKFGKSIFGTTRSLVFNMITGVSEGWAKKLELVGTGYRAEVRGKTLVLTVGYSHPVEIEAPEGITFLVEKTIITVAGADKHMVGQVSANIRKVRPPEPYKGKGIKYIDEVIRRKAGKAAKAAGAA
jgi:large subunit ribosomal protein L6